MFLGGGFELPISRDGYSSHPSHDHGHARSTVQWKAGTERLTVIRVKKHTPGFGFSSCYGHCLATRYSESPSLFAIRGELLLSGVAVRRLPGRQAAGAHTIRFPPLRLPVAPVEERIGFLTVSRHYFRLSLSTCPRPLSRDSAMILPGFTGSLQVSVSVEPTASLCPRPLPVRSTEISST